MFPRSFLGCGGLLCLLLIGGCHSTTSGPVATSDLSALRALSERQGQGLPEAMTGIRFAALRDTALSLGARGGLAWRAHQINTLLQQQAEALDQVFLFERLILDNRVLPPVMIEGRQTLEQANTQTLRIADRAYVIQSQARFVTLAPTWRDYLWMDESPPTLPDKTLLPRDNQERALWAGYIDEGWQAGLAQADNIIAENIHRLTRDFNGMVRYRSLLAQNMVSPPFVAQMDLGITGSGNEMAINDRVLRITALPQLQTDGQQWQTTLTEDPS